MNINTLKEKILKDSMKVILSDLYGSEVYINQKERYLSLIEKFKKNFTNLEVSLISSPGRTELGGNHTDHNTRYCINF
jgi:galactokinase